MCVTLISGLTTNTETDFRNKPNRSSVLHINSDLKNKNKINKHKTPKLINHFQQLTHTKDTSPTQLSLSISTLPLSSSLNLPLNIIFRRSQLLQLHQALLLRTYFLALRSQVRYNSVRIIRVAEGDSSIEISIALLGLPGRTAGCRQRRREISFVVRELVTWLWLWLC